MNDTRTLYIFMLLLSLVGIAAVATVKVCEHQREAAKEVSR